MDVRAALEQVGFFSIVGHGITWTEVAGIYEQCRSYHRLPAEVKLATPMTATTMGYIPLGGAKRGDRPHALNAAFFVGRPGSKRNRFPDATALPGFADAVTGYYRLMEQLCARLLPLYALAAEMAPDYFDQFFEPSQATLRLSHYPPVPADADQWGIDPHSDAGFMTLLPTNPVAGLQIQPHGENWFAVAQEPESFVDVDRYAIPFFLILGSTA